MDVAYDHIVEQTYSGDRASTPTPPKAGASPNSAPTISETRPNLQSEFQETFKAFSNSPWGSKLGGLWGSVRKQGESYYEGARREAEAASGEALKGFADLKESIVSRTRGMSIGEQPQTDKSVDTTKEKAETLPADADASLRENDTFIARFRSEAAKRLKDIEKAEDAADEALLRFGTNIRNFLKDAVSVAPPENQQEGAVSDVLFESKDASGKRVIHTSRFDAQLHVIHTTATSFTQDPSGSRGEWSSFKDGFDIDQKTDSISKDLDEYPDLRNAMEKLVPEKVEYKDFWCRYYFLRHVIETQEKRRKELLKGMAYSILIPLSK
jgi:BSD domain